MSPPQKSGLQGYLHSRLKTGKSLNKKRDREKRGKKERRGKERESKKRRGRKIIHAYIYTYIRTGESRGALGTEGGVVHRGGPGPRRRCGPWVRSWELRAAEFQLGGETPQSPDQAEARPPVACILLLKDRRGGGVQEAQEGMFGWEKAAPGQSAEGFPLPYPWPKSPCGKHS